MNYCKNFGLSKLLTRRKNDSQIGITGQKLGSQKDINGQEFGSHISLPDGRAQFSSGNDILYPNSCTIIIFESKIPVRKFQKNSKLSDFSTMTP